MYFPLYEKSCPKKEDAMNYMNGIWIKYTARWKVQMAGKRIWQKTNFSIKEIGISNGCFP
jgi:hypothetical protein